MVVGVVVVGVVVVVLTVDVFVDIIKRVHLIMGAAVAALHEIRSHVLIPGRL